MPYAISGGASMTETHKEAAKRLAGPMLDKGFKPVALHTYTDANGEPLYWRIRCKHPDTLEKWIRPMKLNGHGYELGEPKYPHGKPLYALHRITSNPGAEVWIAEGEQKADALDKLGLVATTSGSATSADSTDWQPLKGRTVRLWPDNDDPGKAYAGEVASILLGMGCAVSCIDVDRLSLGKGEDVVDWLAAHPGGTGAHIEALPILAPRQDQESADVGNSEGAIVVVSLMDFVTRDIPAREQILSPWLLTQSLNMLYAWRGVGKTHVALGIAYATASGGSFLKWNAKHPRRVLYLDGEMPAASMQERLRGLVAGSDNEFDPDYFRLVTPDLQTGCMPDLATTEGQKAIDEVLGDTELIVVDNLSSLARSGGAENDAASWLPIQPWALRQRQLGRSVLFVHHSGKGGAQRGTSKKEDILDTVLTLKRPADYNPAEGAVFEVHFEKTREMHGDEAQPFEARLQADEAGQAIWTFKSVEDSTFARVVALAKEGLSQKEIAVELDVNKSTVSRHYRHATDAGLIAKEVNHAPF
jgi:hypothetical protein